MRTALVCLLAALAVFAQPQPQPYKADQTYVYRFDTQVSSALLGASPQEIQQQAATRLRADVHITFTSDRHARLQFQQVQIGELNAELPKSQRVQPFERFQRRELQAHLKEQLHMPISFTYVDGAVEAIKFGEKDMAWSKNLKRAALNLLQVNLKRNNVQGLKMETMQEPLDKNTAVFSIPEITVEGECEVTYTVQKPLYKHDEEERREFNVTKSVNFNRCERTADITYGYSQKPAQELRCLNCIRQQQPQADADKIEQIKSAQCQKECRPNAINDQQDVDRSTVARYQLVGKQEKFAVRRASVLSQYLIKGQNPATQNTISQVIAITELVFREQIQGKQVPTFKHSQKEETLMYSPEWDVKEKQFYMYGDEEFEKNSPFAEAQKKDQQAMRSMRSILQAWNNKEQGYELDSALQFNDLVTVLRQCTVKEIEKIEQELRKEAREIGEKSEKQCIEIFEDALSVAATRNTLYVLAKKITQKEMTPIKAAQCLKVFIANQHSPSERQADLLQKICKSEIVQQSPTLKQTAWLTFGAAVGEICQDKPSETRKDYFRTEEMCPRGKKEQYKKVLIEELEKAVSTYHKMVAMKAIGNAALDIVIPELEKIINNKQEATLIRIEAIDALRRLRTNMPQKIQQILLPIFQNQHEQPEIRMTAFTMILYTHPEKSILDQLVFSTLNERSQNVKSFVLTCMNVLAQSPNQAEQEASQHMKAALKAVQIDNEQLKGSRGYRVPIYVSGTENQDEQNLFLGLGAIVSPTNMLPIALGASIRSAFNGQATEENLKVSFHQKNLEQWIGKIADFMNKYASSEELDENATRQSAKELRAIYSSLGLKSRRTGSYYIEGKEADEQMDQASEQPFGMIVVRINEVDKFLIPLEEHSLPQMVKRILKGEKPSLAGLNEWAHLAEGKHFYKHAAATLAEKKTKIPTSSGLPLAIISQFSSIGSIEGQLKLKMNEKKAELKLRTSGIATHLLKTELWTPVLVTGVESVRTVEWSGPIEAQAEMKNGELKLTIRPPQHKQRIFGLHTLPLTYTRQFDDQTKTYREQRVRSVHNYALEHTQYDDFHQKHQANKCIRVEGHVHYPKSLEQFLQAMYTTENNMHVYFHPTETSPKELIIRAAGQSFERVDKYSRPEFETFYQQGFDSEEYDDMSLEKDEQRRSKLTKFVKSYAPKNSYKHNLMVSAEARCAAKTHKVQAEIMGECDSAMKHCKVQLNAERTPMGQESQQWKLQAKLQTITPELIRDDSQLSEKQNRILVQLDSKWGSETEQKMNIRLQAEPTKKQSTWMPAYGSSSEESQEQQQQKPLGWSRFLNKIDLVAEYRLQPHQKHQLKRLFEVAKAYYFWQVQSQPQQGEQDVVRATMILDPINRQYANVSIKTPTERVRVESLRLPVNMPAYKLDRRPHSVHGMRHVIQRFAPWTSNAECRVTPQRVNTFDGVTYKAPLSSCWTVLAKDCSSAESHFSVLMKKTSQENKLKIITREQIIELEKCQDEQEGLCVKINGKIVKDQQELQQEGIHLEQEMVYVNVREIQVRFDGVECHLKLSALYKNTQCGLCGHYSDEEEDVFRMGNNRRTDSIKSFHRSYALKNEECTDQEFAKVYEQESREFRLDSSEESQELKEQRRRWNRNDEMSQESNEWSREQQLESRQQESASYEQNQKVQPVERTLEREHHHKICFSVEPVKRCPRGTVVDEEEQKPKEKKVKFACLNRSSVEARRILRQVRQGRVADLSAFSSSFVESVQQPQQCVVY